MTRPVDNEVPSFFRGYIDLVGEVDDAAIVAALGSQVDIVRAAAASVSPQLENHAYAPGKWSVRQVMGHVGDAERVFGFRAFCFSRADRTPLPAFDENAYVDHARFAGMTLARLVEDFAVLRAANVRLLEDLRDDQWAESGIASGKPITVRALAYVMVGHVRHHLNVLRDRLPRRRALAMTSARSSRKEKR